MRKILITMPDGDIKKYRSQNEAAKELNVSKQTIMNWVNGESKPGGPLKGLQITQVEEDDNGNMTSVRDYRLKKNGQFECSEYNIRLWLATHFDSFAYNELTGNLEINGKPINDLLLDNICVNMERDLKINDEKKTRQCITSLCTGNSYHPLREKIESVEWDGKPHAEDFFIRILGADPTPLNRKYTRCWFKAAIKRLYEPGCMWDNMIIIYDKTQGTGKTKVFERLSLGYYSVDPDISNKDCINIMNNSWIINFDELAKFDKKDMNALKTFIATRSEVNRLAYARYAATYDRHCIFCGTTNEQYFLRDYTSERERRFWVINCKGKPHSAEWWDENLPDEEILQVWAEAKAWYDADPNIEGFNDTDINDEILVQAGHKSFNNNPADELLVRSILNGKYSKVALEDWRAFKKEALNPPTGDAQSFSLDKVEIKRIAALLQRTEDYAAAVVAAQSGWLVRDGFAIKTDQYEIGDQLL